MQDLKSKQKQSKDFENEWSHINNHNKKPVSNNNLREFDQNEKEKQYSHSANLLQILDDFLLVWKRGIFFFIARRPKTSTWRMLCARSINWHIIIMVVWIDYDDSQIPIVISITTSLSSATTRISRKSNTQQRNHDHWYYFHYTL